MKLYKKIFTKYSKIIILFILGAILVSYTFCKQSNKHQLLLRLITQTLNFYHFSPVKLDDNFSTKAFELYFKNLDNSKRFFTKEDFKEFNAYKTRLDDDIKDSNIEFYIKVSERYAANVDKIQGYIQEILSQPFDFSIDETVETDPKKLDYPLNDAALKDTWRKTLKLQVLTRIFSDEKVQKNTSNLPDSARKTFAQFEEIARNSTLKLHNNWFRRIKQTKDLDNYSLFINAIAGVYDPHTQYLSPDYKASFAIGMTGQLHGIGAQLQESDNRVKVVEIVPGSPSWLQGELKAGDLILKVAQENQSAVDIADMPLVDVVKMIRGDKGTKVTLTVQKLDKTIKDITITRGVVTIEETYAKSAIINSAEKQNIGYIYLPSFYANFEMTETGRSSGDDIKLEIEKLKKHKVNGLIIDLRSNGGGSLPEAIKMAGLFINQGPIVQVKTNRGDPRVYFDPDTSLYYSGPVVVLVNQFSASASEIFAAALQDYKRAVIMGSQATFGKGTVQNMMELDNMIHDAYREYIPLGSFKITIQKYYRINGGATQLKGVMPDIVLPDLFSEFKTGEREEDYSMPWTQIKPAPYKEWPNSKNFSAVIKSELNKISNNPDFKIIKEEALQLKKQRDQSIVTLNYEKYIKEENGKDNKSKVYDELMKKDKGLSIKMLPEDEVKFNTDTLVVNRNKRWISDLKKDLHLSEATSVIKQLNTVK